MVHLFNLKTYLHVQRDGDHQLSLPVLPSLAQLCTYDGPVLPPSPSRSGQASHSSAAEAGTCSPGDLSCAECEASLLRLRKASFRFPRANYGR